MQDFNKLDHFLGIDVKLLFEANPNNFEIRCEPLYLIKAHEF